MTAQGQDASGQGSPAGPLTGALIEDLIGKYTLRPMGIHGLPHWARVLETGLRLCPLTGAEPGVVQLFAVFHDCCRLNEGRDRDHGRRAALRVRELRGRLFDLPEDQYKDLLRACEGHTDGLTEGSDTVRTCWDADRLDLGRVGTRIRAEKLCTEAGRDPQMIAWADRRARQRVVPDIVGREWQGRGVS